MKFSLLMPAAGSGSRLGAESPKALVPVSGIPLFIHALTPFVSHEECCEVILAAPANYMARFEDAVMRFLKDSRIRIITGGLTRQDSVHLALRASTAYSQAILIHDAARPFVSGILIQRVLDALKSGAMAALPGLKVVDTLKSATGSPLTVQKTVSRETLFAVQTPQAILKIPAREAFDRAAREEFQATDDVALIEKYALGDVVICEGDPKNFKITTQADLARARDMLERGF